MSHFRAENKQAVCVLMGNKFDCEDQEVSFEEAEAMARQFDLEYFRTSAPTGIGVGQVGRPPYRR